MWFKRLIRLLWAVFGRLLLYGVAMIIILNMIVRHQMEQRGRSWRGGGGGGWRRNNEPTDRFAPRMNRKYDLSIREQIEHYPLHVCVADGNALDRFGDPVDYDHQGMVVRLCSEDCVREFRTDPSHYTKQLLDASLTQ
ncbi:MAG: hypothetical protein ACFHW5_11960 [Verrucomicrobiota bacterium]